MARMSLLQVGRLVALLLVTFFSSIVLGTNAHLLSTTHSAEPQVLLSIAVSTLTVLTIPTMVLIDIFHRRVTVFSYIVVELCWFGVLWAVWLTAAVWSPQTKGLPSCNTRNCDPETDISRVFSFLSFITLFVYTATLLAKSVSLRRTSDRPARIWTGSVHAVFTRNHLRMTLIHIPASPSKTGFGFVVDQDDDPFHPEPVSIRSPSVLLPSNPLSPMRAKSPSALLSPTTPIAVSLPSPISPVYLHA